jgi:hypothetical protein
MLLNDYRMINNEYLEICLQIKKKEWFKSVRQ